MRIDLLSIVLALVWCSAGMAAEEAQTMEPTKKPSAVSIKISPPVYAPTPLVEDPANRRSFKDMSAEEQENVSAARHRRFEIMVLVNAYKILPESERAPLRDELLKRIKEDFQSVINEQKERISRAESDLKNLRNELSEREAHGEELIKRELDRLLNMPMPPHRNRQMRKAVKTTD